MQLLQTQAAQGNAETQNKFGKLYFRGQSVPPNNTTAREWFEKSAAQGNADAQYNLGWLYAYWRAYMWWSHAAAHSKGKEEESEESILDKVAGRMTPAQIAEAQRLSQQCQP
jgi:TPR repeat protein